MLKTFTISKDRLFPTSKKVQDEAPASEQHSSVLKPWEWPFDQQGATAHLLPGSRKFSYRGETSEEKVTKEDVFSLLN